MSVVPSIGDSPSNHSSNIVRIQIDEQREIDGADKWLLVSLMGLFLLLFILTPETPSEWEMDSLVFLVGPPIPNDSNIILLWNPPSKPLSSKLLTFNCNCLVTVNRSYISKARYVIFHWPTLTRLPPIKRPGQLWVWVNTLTTKQTNRRKFLKFQQEYFDCWSTCHEDSDFVIVSNLRWEPSTSLSSSSPSNADSIVKFVPWKNKTKDVVWLKKCPLNLQVDSFISRLKQFVDIDQYDQNTLSPNYDDQKKQTDFFHEIFPKYRYYLALYSATCDNNQPTKFMQFNSSFNLIPIVPNGMNSMLELFYSSKHFIKGDSFSSTESLGRYLQSLKANETALSNYAQPKLRQPDQANVSGYLNLLCDLCSSLQTFSYLKGKCNHGNLELYDWFFNQGNCPNVPSEPEISTKSSYNVVDIAVKANKNQVNNKDHYDDDGDDDDDDEDLNQMDDTADHNGDVYS